MYSYPFLSHFDVVTTGDRAISDSMERRFNALDLTTGVFLTSEQSNSLQVTADTGMKVAVQKGGCNIEGAKGFEDTVRSFTLSAAHTSLKRIDRIVARMDTSDSVRSVELYLKEGSPSSTPVAPDIIRESNYYEIVLADILVKANVTEITAADITDQRLNSALCGMVVPAFPQPLSLDDIHNQIQGFMDEYMAIVEAALDETTAGHLQQEIDATNTALATTNTNVTALQADELIITKTNVSVKASDAVADATFTAYPYRVDIPVTGCTESYRPEIDLQPTDASAVFYDECYAGNGVVSVWVANNTFGTIIIRALQLTKQRGA